MKPDTQHLDYLISQYVDGCLDPASRKSLEQKLVHDPVARRSYKDQREVQDVLDDWGDRIPLIDWNAFDKKLATRLEHEVVGGKNVSRFGMWMRPLAAAAALFVAATIGYSWHAWSVGEPAAIVPVAVNTGGSVAPAKPVQIEATDKIATASSATVTINDAPHVQSLASGRDTVVISSPDDIAAANSLNDALGYGLQMQGVQRSAMVPSNSAAGGTTISGGTAMILPGSSTKTHDDRDAGPGFP